MGAAVQARQQPVWPAPTGDPGRQHLLAPLAGGVALLDAGDGGVRWQSELRDSFVYRAQRVDGGLLVGTTRPTDEGSSEQVEMVARLGSDDGRVIWQVDDAMLVDEAAGLVLVQHTTDGLLALDGGTGDVQWSRTDAVMDLWPTISDRYVAVRDSGAMRALDLRDGEPVTEVAVGVNQMIVALVGRLGVAADQQLAFRFGDGATRGNGAVGRRGP